MTDISSYVEGRDAANLLLNPEAMNKGGDDQIFHWFTRCLDAKKSGRDVVNGTLGSMFNDQGHLAINNTVEQQIRGQPSIELSGYAPLRGYIPRAP